MKPRRMDGGVEQSQTLLHAVLKKTFRELDIMEAASIIQCDELILPKNMSCTTEEVTLFWLIKKWLIEINGSVTG